MLANITVVKRRKLQHIKPKPYKGKAHLPVPLVFLPRSRRSPCAPPTEENFRQNTSANPVHVNKLRIMINGTGVDTYCLQYCGFDERVVPMLILDRLVTIIPSIRI